MNLHQNKVLFRDSIRIAAQQMNIPPVYIEKDYWVTYVLHTIFTNEIGKDAVFKGGTALSKCYKMIDRFSEDIDLAVLRREGETDSKLKSKLKAISKLVETILPEVDIAEITRKMGMNRKTAHIYNKEFTGSYGQVRDVIVLESTWLGYSEHYSIRMIISYIGEMMIRTNQEKLADEYGMTPFEVRILEPTRTLCEKIMSLVRFSYGENPMDDLKKKIRHTYDLHQLLQQKEFSDFLHSTTFDELILKVANDDLVSFKNNKQWLIHHPKNAMIFKDLDIVWKEMIPVYNGEFKNLVYGNLPKDAAVLGTLKLIKEKLESISWSIKIETKD